MRITLLRVVYAFISVVSITCRPVAAQNPLIDSLKKSLQQHPQEDSIKVHIYARIAEEEVKFNDDEAIGYAANAVRVASKINSPESLAKACYMMGKVYNKMESQDSARYYFKEAIRISRQHHFEEWEVRAYSDLGVMEYTGGNDNEALKYFQAGIPIAEHLNHKSLLAALYTNTAGIFFQQEEYEKALRYELKSYRLFRDNPDRRISGVLANVGQEYGALGKSDSAFYYMHMAVAEAYKWKDSSHIAFGYSCIGDQFKEGANGNADSALFYYQKSLLIFNVMGYDDPLLGETYGAVGEIMIEKKRFKEALKYLKTSEEILSDANYLDQLVYTYQSMAKAYRALGDHRNAYLYLEKYSSLHDTLTDIAKTSATAELERKFSLSQKEKEIELLNKDKLIQEEEAKQQRLLKNIFIGGAVLLLLFAFLMWNRFRLKQRTTKQLEEKNKLIEKEKLRAEQSEQFKSQFLANMSHEIRTPMNAISGFTNLLFDVEEEEKRMQYLNAIKKSSDNLLVVINDVLDLSKLEAGKMQVERTPFPIREPLNFISETFQLKAAEKNLGWKVEVADDVPRIVIGDASRLTQVLMNLVGNAMKFTEQGSVTLSVMATTRPDFPGKQSPSVNDAINSGGLLRHSSAQGAAPLLAMTFIVTDTGTGIPQNQLEKIFESFTQVNGDKRKYGGTGLGLAISKSLVDLMHGSLEVKSEEGKGSEFSFTIPFEVATEEQWQQYQKKELIYEEDLGEELRGISILVAEDNEYNQLLIADTLRKFIPELKLDVVNNGNEVLNKLTTSTYQLILMDIQMPELDGYETTRVIRNELKMTIPIIALTASVIRTDIDKCIEAGMNSYVSKPFSTKELLSTMAKVLGKKVDASRIVEKEITASASPSKHQWIRLDHLHQLVSGDAEQITRYLQLFNELIQARMIILKEALEMQDYVAVRQTVHTMKPQLASLGLQAAIKLAETIESNFHREERIPGDAEELMQECAQALEEVRQELGVIY